MTLHASQLLGMIVLSLCYRRMTYGKLQVHEFMYVANVLFAVGKIFLFLKHDKKCDSTCNQQCELELVTKRTTIKDCCKYSLYIPYSIIHTQYTWVRVIPDFI